jgi:hypothetical protein
MIVPVRCCRIYVGVVAQSTPTRATARPINTIRDHHHLTAVLGLGPAFHEINRRQVRASVCTGTAQRKPERFGRRCMIIGEILDNLNRGISHVSDSD